MKKQEMDEKEKRAAELLIANKELAFQNAEKEKRAAELVIANKELAYQVEEKAKRAEELIIANKELAYQNEEKQKRADELVIANKELAYQVEEKEKRVIEKDKRAAELVIANKELAFQNEEKKKRAEELIIANYARSMLEASLDPLVTINEDGKITDVNNALILATGFSREKLIGTDFSKYFTEPEKALQSYQQVFEKGFVADYPLILQHKNGKETEVLYNASIYKDDKGNILGVFAAVRDVTKQNIANKELAFQNEEKQKRADELVIANKELAFQNEEKQKRADELVIANKELESFSYSVSHDLRAPLRHINGYVDLLLNRFYDSLPDNAKHYLDSIADSSRQMSMLIDDLLQFSRTNRQEMRLMDIDMNGLVLEVIQMIKQDIPKRNIEWNISKLPKIYGDQGMLQLVWSNLLSNAVKFTCTREKTIIEIKAQNRKEEYVFSVSDNGVGFDMQYAQKLFGIFQRLHSTEEFEGTGIGLANVRRIISKHGGRTWAEAEPDKGATFFFSLPINNKEKFG